MSLDKQKVARSFNRASSSYEDVAVVQQAVLTEHLERLDISKIEPKRILDLGSGTGTGSQELLKKYKKSRLIATDIAQGMLEEHKKRLPRFLNKTDLVCADLDFLPIKDKSIDLIFSNLAIQWSDDLNGMFNEFNRIMRTGGLLSFTTVGPDTMKELRDAWHKVDNGIHVHAFLDMHEIGDALINSGFSEPVLDVDRYTLNYPDLKSLLVDLKLLGTTNASSGRSRSMTSRKTFEKLAEAYEEQRIDGQLPLTYEIVYGHAWLPRKDMRPQDGSTVSYFPADGIKRR